MMENRLGWLLLRWLLYLWRFVVVLVLALGISVGAGSIPAHAYCVGSSLCNPANAPIIAELGGAGTAPVGAAATATGSTITAPLATGVGTTAAGSTIAAEVWGGTAAVALSAAGWLAAKAFLSPEELPLVAPPDEVKLGAVLRKYNGGNYSDVTTAPDWITVDYEGSWGQSPGILHWSFPPSSQYTTSGWGNAGSFQANWRCNPGDTWQTYSNGTAFTSSAVSAGRTVNLQLTVASCVKEIRVRTSLTFSGLSVATYSDWVTVPIDGDPANVGSPVYFLETQLDCTGGGTQSFSSDSFSEVPLDGVSLPQRLCPNGQKVTRTRVWLRVVGHPALDKLISDVTVPEYLQELVPDACVTSGTDDCSLDLQKDGQSIVGKQSEADWEVKAGAAPGRYRCSFGGVQVDIKFCRAVYGSQPRMSEEVTESEPVPTEEPLPYPSTAPDWPPLGDPLPPTPGTDNGSCIRWSLGGILSGEVMFQAVGCALEWAFVPDPATLTATASVMSASWYTSGPVLFMSQGSGIISATGDSIGDLMSGNCQGPAINLPNYSEPLYLLNACDPPVSTVAGWTHLGSAFVFAFIGLVGALRVVLGAFNIHLPWSKSTAEEGSSV